MGCEIVERCSNRSKDLGIGVELRRYLRAEIVLFIGVYVCVGYTRMGKTSGQGQGKYVAFEREFIAAAVPILSKAY